MPADEKCPRNLTAVESTNRADGSPAFTVCVLLYGDYPELAKRCLFKLADLHAAGRIALRIGANSISTRTMAVLQHLRLAQCMVCWSRINIRKYPMMARIFGLRHSEPKNCADLITPYVMWFDDDSYINAEDPFQWLKLMEEKMEGVDMIGAVYSIRLKGKQSSWIKKQTWYNGISVPRFHCVSFCTGGWWTIRTDLITRFQWPCRELVHRGGDVMLGELCRQQNLKVIDFNPGVAINADAKGVSAKAPRRGFDSAPIGFE